MATFGLICTIPYYAGIYRELRQFRLDTVNFAPIVSLKFRWLVRQFPRKVIRELFQADRERNLHNRD